MPSDLSGEVGQAHSAFSNPDIRRLSMKHSNYAVQMLNELDAEGLNELWREATLSQKGRIAGHMAGRLAHRPVGIKRLGNLDNVQAFNDGVVLFSNLYSELEDDQLGFYCPGTR